jgi:8-oxo-dGTP pyrophosphatase MutT (NUDIX family)
MSNSRKITKSSSYVLFYRRNSAGTDFDFYITYNYSTFSSNIKEFGLDDYKVKFQKPDGTKKTHDELVSEISHFTSEITTKYGIPEKHIRLKLSKSGYQIRFVTGMQESPNFFNLPGGGSNPGESNLDTAVREVHEELGFDKVELASILGNSSITTLVGDAKKSRFVYLVNADKINGSSIHKKLVKINPTAYETYSCEAGKELRCVASESEIITADWTNRSFLSTHLAKFSFVLSRI